MIEVSGRLYPVEVRYRPVGGDAEDTTRDEEEQALGDAVEELFREGPGDVLVFLPGEREIRDAAEVLAQRRLKGAEILPLYGRLSAAEQDRVFHPGGARRVVLATNVAETSLTVPRIRYVVDTGQARVKRYCYRNKVEMLRVEHISQAAAQQRAGRCGRVADGICIRLYSEEEFAKRPGVHRPGGAALLARRGDPAREEPGHRRDRDLPVPRSAQPARDHRRLRPAARAGCGRRRTRADRRRPRARAAAARSARRRACWSRRAPRAASSRCW